MRHVLSLFVLLGLAGGVFAREPAAPTEAAAFSATRNLLHALNTAKGTDRLDALARHVDGVALAERAFGEGLEGLGAEQRAMLGRSIMRFLAGGLFDKMPHPKEPNRVELESSELPGARRVEFNVGEDTVHFVWAGETGAPMLVDLGNPKDGYLSRTLGKMWASSEASPTEFVAGLLPKSAEKPTKPKGLAMLSDIIKSKDNLRTLVTLMIARRMERVTGGWPPYNGKNFVLALVATNLLDQRNPQNLTVLFSPGDKRITLEKAGAAAYKEVHKKALKAGTDFRALTSYAGRRNAEREYLITPDQEKRGTAVMADLSFPDRAIVAFSNGAVREMNREALGLGPEDPLVVGDESKSEILRVLSDR